MQLTEILCYTLLMVTIAATSVQSASHPNDIEAKKLEKRGSRRTATVVVEGLPPGKVYQQPKVIYRKISPKSYVPPKTTYRPRRTKYGPPRTQRKPAKKYRSKGVSKHAPFPYKKRATKPKYGMHKRPFNPSSYRPPKKTPNRIYNGIGFGEPPSGYSYNKYRPPKPTEFSRPNKPENYKELTSRPYDMDFSSPATLGDSFSNKPFDEFSPQHEINPFPNPQGYGEPPMDAYEHKPLDSYGNVKSGEPPVDSYGAPIQSNLHDLTFATAQTFLESTSHLDEEMNFGPQSRPWNNFKDEPDNSYAFSKKRPSYTKLEESEEIFVTPVPEKQNEELSLNSYSDIYNYRQMQENKKKKKTYYQNVKMLNHPWKGPKIKEVSNDEIIVGGQYAEPPARFVTKLQPSTSMLEDDETIFSQSANFPNPEDLSAPISSYVNYKNSNMAFSPQNLNDAFSIIEK